MVSAEVFGTTEWRTYGTMGEMAHAFGAGLRALGMRPQQADAMTADHKGVLIYDETGADWMICAQGAISAREPPSNSAGRWGPWRRLAVLPAFTSDSERVAGACSHPVLGSLVNAARHCRRHVVRDARR